VAVHLLIGLRYRVGWILHEYLGRAFLPGSDSITHVALRNEWRPDTPDQLPLTLVEDSQAEEMVTPTRIRGRR
jgi:hypothetical protein